MAMMSSKLTDQPEVDMETKMLSASSNDIGSSSWMQPAVDALRREEVVGFPTETVYGLGALWRSSRALREVFRIKGRPQDNPLILHVSSEAMAWSLASVVPEAAVVLAKAFWPGPLTLILPADSSIPPEVTAGLSTVGLRCPMHPLALQLIELTGEPLAAPSANISGRPSPTRSEDVLEDLNGRIPYVIEGGASAVGLESTIVDLSHEGEAHLLRPGGVTVRDLDCALERAGLNIHVQESTLEYGQYDLAAVEIPRAPGMKYRHYAPRAPIHIFRELDAAVAAEELQDWLRKVWAETDVNSRIGLFVREDVWRIFAEGRYEKPESDQLVVEHFPADDLGRAAAHGLFAAFRHFDRQDCDMIGVSAMPEDGYGGAYMNRLAKAAGAAAAADRDEV